MVVLTQDNFGRTTVNGFGSADIGGAYTVVGTSTDFQVNGGVGKISGGAAGNTRTAYLSTTLTTRDIIRKYKLSYHAGALPSGSDVATRMLVRAVDSNNAYIVGMLIRASDSKVTLTFGKIVSGTVTTFDTFLTGVVYAVADVWNLKVKVSGANPTRIQAKLWKDGTTEPWYWQWEIFDSTFTAGQTAGKVGMRMSVPAGYAGSLPITWWFDTEEADDLSAEPLPAWRPYKFDSFWNSPIPVDAPIDPNSVAILNYILGASSYNHVRISGCDFSDVWGIPYYFNSPSDPERNVTSSVGATMPPEFATMRIPTAALPSVNTDAVMAIIDMERKIIYDLHKVVIAGTVYTVDYGSVYYISSNGLEKIVAGTDDLRNTGHRGAPISIGAARVAEFQAGQIQHMLRAASHYNAPQFVWPMSGSDGSGASGMPVPPEGTIIRLKQSIDLTTYSLSPIARIIAKALQEYGCIIGDSSGANFEIKVENTEVEGGGGQPNQFDVIGLKNNSLSAFVFPTDYEVIKLGWSKPGTDKIIYWDVNGMSLQTYAHDIETLGSGRDNVPPLRGQNRLVPYRAGTQHKEKFPDQRVISLQMWVRGVPDDTPNGTPDASTFWENWRALKKLIWNDRATQVELRKRWIEGDQIMTARALAEYAGGLEITTLPRWAGKFVVDFLLADPYFYGGETSQDFVLGDPPVVLNNPGDVRADAYGLSVLFVGPLTNPVLLNNTPVPPVSLQLNMSLAVDEAVGFDVDAALAYDQAGNNVVDKITHTGTRSFFELLPGDNEITFTADDGTGTASVDFRPPYL